MTVKFFSLLWAALKDVYHQFAYFVALSMIFFVLMLPTAFVYLTFKWSILTLPIFLVGSILVPPTITTLYTLVDPRMQLTHPEVREIPGIWLRSFKRSWLIALYTIFPLVVIGWNIAYFAGSDHPLQILIPLWVVMWVFIFVFAQYCFCLSGTLESSPRNAFRGGMFVMVKYPIRAVFLSLGMIALGYAFTITVLPMLVFGPTFFAAVVTRFTFDAFEVYVDDPEKPTDERAWERERGLNEEKPLIQRMFRKDAR